jgi:hypothetical protein
VIMFSGAQKICLSGPGAAMSPPVP